MKFKNLYKFLCVGVMMPGLSLLFAGCTTTGGGVGPSQQATINPLSQSCGMIAGIGVTTMPHSSPRVCTAVSNIMAQFSLNVSVDTNGLMTATCHQTYYSSIAAAVQADTHFTPNDKAIILAATALALQGIDMIFTQRPELIRDAATVNVAVQWFVLGMQQGLATARR